MVLIYSWQAVNQRFAMQMGSAKPSHYLASLKHGLIANTNLAQVGAMLLGYCGF